MSPAPSRSIPDTSASSSSTSNCRRRSNKGVRMLADAQVSTRLPAKDLTRARKFYSEKLGLEPVEERPGGLRYHCAGGFFALFESAGSASGTHTQMALEVDDLEATMAALKARGVVFEEYDAPGLKTVNGVADIKGNYPSKGVGERGAWFRDSEGNLIGLGQPVRWSSSLTLDALSSEGTGRWLGDAL